MEKIMATIGIIANPASGKDIRRLVSHATVIDNNEKVNIIERIILGAQPFGLEKIYIMPDSYMMGYKVREKLLLTDELNVDIEVLDMKIKASPKDTEAAAQMLESMGVDCVIVMGGDGTNRLAAKHLKTVPMIGVSTGTNNAYPEMIEGTVAGMAAAAVAFADKDIDDMCSRDKIIEIHREGKVVDMALMDVVISDEIFVGSKAIWDLEHIKQIIVSKCHPASIGFSAIVGVNQQINASDDFGGSLKINGGDNHFYAPIAAGKMISIEADDLEIVPIDHELKLICEHKGIIAVDGEREIPFNQGDRLTFKITRNGPLHVDVRRTLEIALKRNFFKK
jgi:predicted polyphosphate/ATP-dependent NAD kinase